MGGAIAEPYDFGQVRRPAQIPGVFAAGPVVPMAAAVVITRASRKHLFRRPVRQSHSWPETATFTVASE
jgi:hypothetical protein